MTFKTSWFCWFLVWDFFAFLGGLGLVQMIFLFFEDEGCFRVVFVDCDLVCGNERLCLLLSTCSALEGCCLQ